MLHFFDPARTGDRRAFLKIGSLALGGLSLSDLHAAEVRSVVRDKAVIFVFLQGGPSQYETFDPKMTAPAEIRSATGETPTKIPGVTFGPTFTKLAARADKLAIVRSYVPGDANHDIKPIVGKESFGSGLGAIRARIAGINHPATGLPTNVNLFPTAIDSAAQKPNFGFGRFDAVGPFGTACAPFDPSGGGPLLQDMRLALPLDRLHDRRRLLAGFDRVNWRLNEGGGSEGLDRTREQAFQTLIGGASAAFDLTKEDPRTIARYDTAALVKPNAINPKWKNRKLYADHVKSFGKLLLLARRLCEHGCGFVTLNAGFVWDMHADQNNAGVVEGMGYVGSPLDHALSAYIDDVEASGLSEKIMLVVCGEMGRTPRLNKNGGRDHWGNLGPLLLHGGGLRTGQVIGRSDRTGGTPQTDPMTIRHVIGTLLHTLFDVGQLRLVSSAPREIAQVMTTYETIPGLLG